MKSKVKQIIALAGPTASGKTDLAAQLMKKYPLEIISADSRQVYRKLDIGSGKDKDVPQFLIDVANPDDGKQRMENRFTVADFKELAEEKMAEIWQRGNTPLIVGGTGFYIESLIFEQVVNQTPPDVKIRRRLNQLSNEELFNVIKNIDPVTSERIDRNNRRRLIRAAEIVSITGKPVSQLDRQLRKDLQIHLFVLDLPREELYKRIDVRVDGRLGLGMVDEVKNLIAAGVSIDWLKSLGLEYRSITQYLLGEFEYSEMVQRLKYNIHAFARRQISFFKRWPLAVWGDNQKIFTEIEQLFIRK